MDFLTIFNDITEQILPVILRYRQDVSTLGVKLKDDKTFVTNADFDIQRLVMDIILKYDSDANFIAEENNYTKRNKFDSEYTWIVDPIDGTSQFINPDSKEYCTAICVIEKGRPVSAMILLPELGIGGTHILVSGLVGTNQLYVNNELANGRINKAKTHMASVTKRAEEPLFGFEDDLFKKGYTLKTKATSQSIDQLRTAVDISDITEPSITPLDFFYRGRQKIWDGAAGICLNLIAGKKVIHLNGRPIIPFPIEILEQQIPTQRSIFEGDIAGLEEILLDKSNESDRTYQI